MASLGLGVATAAILQLQLSKLANQSNVKTVVKTFSPISPKNRNIKITFTFLLLIFPHSASFSLTSSIAFFIKRPFS